MESINISKKQHNWPVRYDIGYAIVALIPG